MVDLDRERAAGSAGAVAGAGTVAVPDGDLLLPPATAAAAPPPASASAHRQRASSARRPGLGREPVAEASSKPHHRPAVRLVLDVDDLRAAERLLDRLSGASPARPERQARRAHP